MTNRQNGLFGSRKESVKDTLLIELLRCGAATSQALISTNDKNGYWPFSCRRVDGDESYT